MSNYLVVDYSTGKAPADLVAFLNGYGADGWSLIDIDLRQATTRRAIFIMATAPVEYTVIDYDTGKTTEELQAELDGLGVDGWELLTVDMRRSNVRRSVLMRGGGGVSAGGGIPEAPQDGNLYGRIDLSWGPISASYLPLVGGTLTGSLLLAADPAVPLEAATMQYVDAQVSTVAGGTVSASYNARPQTQDAADPGNGSLVWNTTTQIDATQIYVSVISSSTPADDVHSIWNNVTPGQTLHIQKRTDHTQEMIYTINSIIDNITWFFLDVTPISSTGGTFSANESLTVVLPSTANVFLPIAGGTLTGPLTLNADPIMALDAATKQYVDSALLADAPADDVTYGRMNNAWNPALAKSNDICDGGNF